MISPKAFYDTLAREGLEFLTGVPDSLLKEFCYYVDAALPAEKHLIAANEGTAVAIAAGVHLATGSTPMVYLQNSGLGNTINPLLSLADPEVYAIPMVVLVGWRGQPGVKDEPQHRKQGRVTCEMLSAMELPWRELTGDSDEAEAAAIWALSEAATRQGPVVLLAHKGAFSKAEERRSPSPPPKNWLSREAALGEVTSALAAGPNPGGPIVSTTGMISREIYEHRCQQSQPRDTDFLTVGSMGHASQIALGIALAAPNGDVTCIDGDGAALMHLGGMATIGTQEACNLLHVVLNNGVHDSVGGQPTVGFRVSLTEIASACGYDTVMGPVESAAEIADAMASLGTKSGRRFLEIRVCPGSRPDLGRPKESPAENKALFVTHLRNRLGIQG